MRYISIFMTAAVGCSAVPAEPITVPMPSRLIDYQFDVKPILDRRCVVCHSCYNSPCQLKLSSYEGVDRGASKKAIYNGTRLTTMDPTRLFTDAKTTEEWRQKEFFSVTESKASAGQNDSTMIQLLSHKMHNPKSVGDYHPEADDLTCAENNEELGGYLEKHPNRGMPFGFPPLEQREFDLIAGWLAQGARGPDPELQAALTSPKEADALQMRAWEEFLNQEEPKVAMTARYLYEHFFLAHLRFDTPTHEFFEIVRSRTPPGQPIDLVATVRPYDDPGVERVYYRFRKIHSTIVFKTHMVVELSAAKLERIQELFIAPEWLQEPHLVGYDPKLAANPFVAFEQIPPRARYQLLLDHSHYMIMTFIRGPVCKGQIALNVINDHFWVLFVDPDHDLSVQNPGFLKMHADDLRMPIELGSGFGILDVLTDEYFDAAKEFYRHRQDFYVAHNFGGLGYDSIWRGNSSDDAPLLTIYRHFDSASVHKGVLGNLPKTMWVIDYPLLERIYYALVAGFDIYGDVGHQLAVRLYMDALRVEGESYFLDFLPSEDREQLMQQWYPGFDLAGINYYPTPMPTQIAYETDEPSREFIEHVVGEHILPETGIAFDSVNYIPAGGEYPPLPESYETLDDYLQGFRALSKPGTAFFSVFDDHSANLVYLRIRKSDGESMVASVVINRWHDDVSFLLTEDLKLDPSKDKADFIPGFIGSYPNYFVDIRQEDLPDFFNLLTRFDGSPEHLAWFSRYGVNRANDNFWEVYDWLQDRFNEDDPIRAGLFDLNRYYYKAVLTE